MKSPLINQLGHYLRRHRPSEGGFTLLELLVAILIGGIITSGLLFLVIELLTVNTREESLTETQQNMKRAINYIGRDLSEAVFVYSDLTALRASLDDTPYSLMDQLDDEPSGTPVLAFWRLDPLTNDEIALLAPATQAERETLAQCDTDECNQRKRILARQTYYTLVVYFYQDNEAGDIWEGPARIVRYELPNFKNISSTNLDDEATAGYADPTLTLVDDDDSFNSFVAWQKGTGNTNGNSHVLTDFINVRNPASSPDCPAGFTRSPAAGDVFYACITQPGAGLNVAGVNKSVLLYLQGNASKGNPGDVVGVNAASSLPTLESEVLIRGIIQNDPSSE